MVFFLSLLDLLIQAAPYLLAVAFIVLEITCIAKTGVEVFTLLIRRIKRSRNSSMGLKYVPTPVRFQAMIMNDTLEAGTAVSVVNHLPLIPDHDKISMTSHETGFPAGSHVFLHSTRGRDMVLTTQLKPNYSPQ